MSRHQSLEGGLLPTRQAFLTVGGGRPLLMLPGLSPDHRRPAGMALRMELQQVRAYAASRRVWWVQRPQDLEPGSTMAGIAAAYATTARQLFDGPVDVVGFSTGGSVGLQLAADHPDVVRRLALVSSACHLGPDGRMAQARIAQLVRGGRRREASGVLMSMLGSSAPARRALDLTGRLLAPVLMGGDLDDMVATIDAEDVFDATPRLPGITAPMLVVGGAEDRFYDVDLFVQTANGVPDGHVFLHPGKGHAGAMSSPLTSEEVLRFLDEA
jgi:pimeloyl-ACP methyl ester carboxylesterase